jgi:hypothetical protein
MFQLPTAASDDSNVGYLIGAAVAYLDTQAAFGSEDEKTEVALYRLEAATRPFVAQDRDHEAALEMARA